MATEHLPSSPIHPDNIVNGHCGTLCYRLVEVLAGRRHQGNDDVVRVLGRFNASQVRMAIPEAMVEFSVRGNPLWNANDYTAYHVRAYAIWDNQPRYMSIYGALARALERK